MDHLLADVDSRFLCYPCDIHHRELWGSLDNSRYHHPLLIRIPQTRFHPTFSAHRAMWTVTNYFLLTLTVSDLLISTINCIPSFIFMRDRVWIYGGLYCKINNFVSYMTVSSSVFTLLAISNDRNSVSEMAAFLIMYVIKQTFLSLTDQ